MKTKSYVWHGALLSLASAAFAVGCGGAPATDPTAGDLSASDSAAIVALGAPIISGCGMSLGFDIAAGGPLGFIGVQNLAALNSNMASNAQSASSALNNMELVLWQVDDYGQLTQVNQQATQASNTMMALLDQYAANSQLAQQSNSGFINNASSLSQFTTTTRDLAAATTTSTFGSEVLDSATNNTYAASHNANAYNWAENATGAASNVVASDINSATALNAFNASSFAKQMSAQEAADWSTNFFNNATVAASPIATPFLFGGIGADFFSNAFATAANVAQSSQFADQAVVTNQNAIMSADQASATQAAQATNAYNQAGSQSGVNSNDIVSNSTNTSLAHAVNQTNTIATNESLAETTSIVADQFNNSAYANDNLALAQNTTSNFVNQAASNAMQQSTLAFSDLSQLNSNHYIMQVNVNAFNEQAAFQVFTGVNDNIVANSSFNQAMPGCY